MFVLGFVWKKNIKRVFTSEVSIMSASLNLISSECEIFSSKMHISIHSTSELALNVLKNYERNFVKHNKHYGEGGA